MQKAVFLVTQQSLTHWSPYSYEPYNWGPYSQQLTDDLHSCEDEQLLVLSFAGGNRYGRYLATRDGQQLIDQIWDGLPGQTTKYLGAIRSWVTSKNFNSLLRDVYAEYPDFATKSQWRNA